MAKVSFIGCGKLGQPCAEMVAEKHDVVGYDVNTVEPDNFKMVSRIKDAVIGRDIIFIAAPTPHDPKYDGSEPTSHLPPKDFDYSIVREILKEVNVVVESHQIVVLISTVLPGTVRREFKDLIPNAKFVYSPFLIAMGTVKYDMVNPEMVMIGTSDGSETDAASVMKGFYQTIMENGPRYIIGTWEEMESLKVFYNSFISAKVSLVNMIQDTAEQVGHMNSELVCDALAASTRRIMGPSYMKPGMGDGGNCVLPTFPIEVNGEIISIQEFHDNFNPSKVNLVKSAKYSMSGSDQKKVFESTLRDFDGEILVFHTKSGKTLECTPSHLLPVNRDGSRLLIRADAVLATDRLFSVK